MVRNWLFEGRVFHERLLPFNHKFSYSLFYLKFPLSQMSELNNLVFSIDKLNVFSLFSQDYLDGSKRPLMDKIKEVLESEGVTTDGEIILHTIPRIFGYGFNPVSFWYIYDLKGKLEAILNEVNNTFGDRHYYLLQSFDQFKNVKTKKVFHVSPFFDVAGSYEFSFSSKSISVDYYNEDRSNLLFSSQLKETSVNEFSKVNLLKFLITYPLMTFMVMYRIHWQALRLFLKKAKFFKRPDPPTTMLTKEVYR